MNMPDMIDRRILRELAGRWAGLDSGSLPSGSALSPTATSERIKRLQREGYIAG